MSGSARRPSRSRRALTLALGVALVGGLAGVPVLSGLAGASTSSTVGNLLGGDTVSLVSGTGSWTASGVTGLNTFVWPDGTGSLVVTAKAPGNAVVQTGRTSLRVTPGSAYSGAFGLAAGTTGERVQPFLAW